MDVIYAWWCFAKLFWMDAQDFQLRRYINDKVFIGLHSDDNWSFWSLNTFRATVKIQIFDGTIKSDEQIGFQCSIIKKNNSSVIFSIVSDLFLKIPFLEIPFLLKWKFYIRYLHIVDHRWPTWHGHIHVVESYKVK